VIDIAGGVSSDLQADRGWIPDYQTGGGSPASCRRRVDAAFIWLFI